MTIRVEREALLMVINTSSLSLTTTTSSPFSSLSYNPCIRDNDDEFVIVDSVPTINKGKNDFFYSDITYTRDDDQASLCTISTTSDFSFYSTSDSSIIVDRRVSFAPQLVTDIWTRPRTVPEDVSTLFYSAQETQKFRQEYRLERKLLSELSINPETFPVNDEELSNLVTATATTATSPSSSENNGRHRISRVVVLHDDKLKTFFNPGEQLLLPDNNKEEEREHQQHSAYSQQATSCISGGGDDSDSSSSSSSEDFFDNDSFWSGSLTWY